MDQLTADYKRDSQGLYCINARRALSMPMDQRGNPVPFSEWLADPNRVVGLVYPPASITQVGDRVWEIELVNMSCFGMAFIPVYELHILWLGLADVDRCITQHSLNILL